MSLDGFGARVLAASLYCVLVTALAPALYLRWVSADGFSKASNGRAVLHHQRQLTERRPKTKHTELAALPLCAHQAQTFVCIVQGTRRTKSDSRFLGDFSCILPKRGITEDFAENGVHWVH